jgi:Tol biopolymer transport system component
MDGNGGNAHAVTTSVSNAQPAWSPNGTQLVYRHNEGCDYSTCTDFLSVINADGSGDRMLTPQTNQPPNDPDWSPDGEWIAFGAGQCDDYYYYSYYLYCYGTGLGAVHPDGSGRVQILYGSMHSPAWRP